jgi:hypothetical protein
VTLATAAFALWVGAAAPLLERSLRPGGGAWLDAFERAESEAGRGEPDDAIRGVLLALRELNLGAASARSPELWTLLPSRVTSVDAAGYLHERDAQLPEGLLQVAAAEPEGTLRAPVLEALEVRRPDLRPLAVWMADRGVALASLIESGGEADGVLVIGRGTRPLAEPPTLEEVRALKRVADRLASPCRARGTSTRLLALAHEQRQRAEAAEERVELLRHERALDAGRAILATARIARAASVGVYSAEARMALDALERRASLGAPIAVVAPPGVDPAPYLARAHLSGARRTAHFVLVDGASSSEHDPARWCDPEASPLALAHRGMLVLLDGAALPVVVQELIAGVLAQRRAPWERADALDIQLALTGLVEPETLVAKGRLDAALAVRLGDARSAPIVLPRLRHRSEDLRALLTDRLAREGLRVLGRPVGIEQAAYARLVEYTFPGEEAELALLVQRMVARCRGDLVCAADIDALRLSGTKQANVPSNASGDAPAPAPPNAAAHPSSPRPTNGDTHAVPAQPKSEGAQGRQKRKDPLSA